MDGALGLFYLVCALVSLTCIILLAVVAPHHESDLGVSQVMIRSDPLSAESAVAIRTPNYQLEDTYILPDEEGDNGLGSPMTWSKSLRILAVGETRTGVGSGRVVLLKHVSVSTTDDDDVTTTTFEFRRGGTFESDFDNDRFSEHMAWGRKSQVLTVTAPAISTVANPVQSTIYTYQVSVSAAGDVSSNAVAAPIPLDVDTATNFGAVSYGLDDRHIIVSPHGGEYAHIFYKVPRSVSVQWMDAITSDNASEWRGGTASSNGNIYMYGAKHVDKYRNKGATYVHVERKDIGHNVFDMVISEDGVHGVLFVEGNKLVAFRDDGSTDETNYGEISEFVTDRGNVTSDRMALTSSGALLFICGFQRVEIIRRISRNTYAKVGAIPRPDGASINWPSSVACTFNETGRHTVFTGDTGSNRVYSHHAQL